MYIIIVHIKSLSEKSPMPQINIKVDEETKKWAQQRAKDNYQSLSKFVVMLIDKEKERVEKQQSEVKCEIE